MSENESMHVEGLEGEVENTSTPAESNGVQPLLQITGQDQQSQNTTNVNDLNSLLNLYQSLRQNINTNPGQIPPNISQDVNNTIEATRTILPSLFRYTCYSIPLLMIPFIIFAYYHFWKMFYFVISILSAFLASLSLQKAISDNDPYTTRGISIFFNHLFFSFQGIFLLIVFREEELWKGLYFMNGHSYEFGYALWAVVQLDLCVKLIAIGLKNVLFFCISKLQDKHKGRPYHMFEQVFDVYRILIPMGIWIRYGFTLPLFIQLFVIPLYGLHKGWNVVRRVLPFFRNIKHILSRGPMYGKYVTNEITVESGQTCSICMDTYQRPVILECNHIFCEECVNQWFIKEKSCPICRHEVADRGQEKFADGSSDLLITLF